MRRDLKWQRKYGIKYFLRRPYHDLNELFELEQRMLQQGHENTIDCAAITGFIVIGIAPLTNTRLPLNQKQFDEELVKGEYRLLLPTASEGFG